MIEGISFCISVMEKLVNLSVCCQVCDFILSVYGSCVAFSVFLSHDFGT